MSRDGLERITAEVVECRRCPRLVAWREQVAEEKRASFKSQDYWGKPVPSFGDPNAKVLIVGLAPAAHGGNRTGRVFTGDRSGDWLFASLYRTGFANQPHAVSLDDGLRLEGAFIAATVRCAPPANKPTTDERDTCMPYLERELRELRSVTVMVALGSFAWDACLRISRSAGVEVPRPKPRFGHGMSVHVGPRTLLGCYHPSQQNTFTGKLTEPMLDDVFATARQLAGI